VSDVPRLHQFVPTLDPGAVGSHVLEIQQTLRRLGWDSEVFSEHTRPPYTDAAHPHTAYGAAVAAHPDDIIVYHMAIGSSVADWLLARRPARLVAYSHNITPPAWFEEWEPPLSYGLAWGRAQLQQLARRSILGLGVSEYNTRELATYGFRHTEVLPILLDPASLDHAGLDPAGRDKAGVPVGPSGPGSTWLFVGRLAPNKCQQDVIKAFVLYRRVYDPNARLWLVGGSSSDRYADALVRFAADAGVADAVTFTGAVPAAELAARYAGADVFVCLSEHEGFLVPLLEAWYHNLPIVAYSAAAVPETLGDAGLLLSDKSPETVAAAVARVCTDPAVRQALVDRGNRRLERFSLARTEQRLVELATSIAAGAYDRGRRRDAPPSSGRRERSGPRATAPLPAP
jgi:glycosyltransferase involved in cell wall biosynthesis